MSMTYVAGIMFQSDGAKLKVSVHWGNVGSGAESGRGNTGHRVGDLKFRFKALQ